MIVSPNHCGPIEANMLHLNQQRKGFPTLYRGWWCVVVQYLHPPWISENNSNKPGKRPATYVYSFALNNPVSYLRHSLIILLDFSPVYQSSIIPWIASHQNHQHWGRLSLGRPPNASVDPKVQLPWKRKRYREGTFATLKWAQISHFQKMLAWCLSFGFLSVHNLMWFLTQHIWI